MKRFYPDFIPMFPNEPKVYQFKIVTISEKVGEGVVSKTVFSKGDIVFAFTGVVLDFITQFTLRDKQGQHIHDPFFMGKVLHSCDPNTTCDMEKRTFTAKRDILPGELITMDYEETEASLFKPFLCQCGAKNCKGLIAGSASVESEISLRK